MNKNLTAKQDTALVLNKSKSTLSITKRILSGSINLNAEVVEEWIRELWQWADEHEIASLELTYDDDWNEYWHGLARNKNDLINATYMYLQDTSIVNRVRHGIRDVKELPNEIENITTLTELYLDFEQLTRIPSSFGNLHALKTLMVKSQHIKKLPLELENLENLEIFICIGDVLVPSKALDSFPKVIVTFNNLIELTLKGHGFTSMPSTISNLKNLKKLDISCNDYLKEIPKEIGAMINLTELNLSENSNLTFLPLELTNLTNLKILNIGYLQSSCITNEHEKWITYLKSQGCDIKRS